MDELVKCVKRWAKSGEGADLKVFTEVGGIPYILACIEENINNAKLINLSMMILSYFLYSGPRNEHHKIADEIAQAIVKKKGINTLVFASEECVKGFTTSHSNAVERRSNKLQTLSVIWSVFCNLSCHKSAMYMLNNDELLSILQAGYHAMAICNNNAETKTDGTTTSTDMPSSSPSPSSSALTRTYYNIFATLGNIMENAGRIDAVDTKNQNMFPEFVRAMKNSRDGSWSYDQTLWRAAAFFFFKCCNGAIQILSTNTDFEAVVPFTVEYLSRAGYAAFKVGAFRVIRRAVIVIGREEMRKTRDLLIVLDLILDPFNANVTPSMVDAANDLKKHINQKSVQECLVTRSFFNLDYKPTSSDEGEDEDDDDTSFSESEYSSDYDDGSIISEGSHNDEEESISEFNPEAFLKIESDSNGEEIISQSEHSYSLESSEYNPEKFLNKNNSDDDNGDGDESELLENNKPEGSLDDENNSDNGEESGAKSNAEGSLDENSDNGEESTSECNDPAVPIIHEATLAAKTAAQQEAEAMKAEEMKEEERKAEAMKTEAMIRQLLFPTTNASAATTTSAPRMLAKKISTMASMIKGTKSKKKKKMKDEKSVPSSSSSLPPIKGTKSKKKTDEKSLPSSSSSLPPIKETKSKKKKDEKNAPSSSSSLPPIKETKSKKKKKKKDSKSVTTSSSPPLMKKKKAKKKKKDETNGESRRKRRGKVMTVSLKD